LRKWKVFFFQILSQGIGDISRFSDGEDERMKFFSKVGLNHYEGSLGTKVNFFEE
jgi:hypothetical protein